MITEQQKKLNKALHEKNASFGRRDDGAGLATNLGSTLIRLHELGICNSVLDYGTGKGLLVDKLRREMPSTIKVTGYDPAVDQWDTIPSQPSDIVVCLDVLEHIEISEISNVLHDINRYTTNFCYLVIDLQPAVKKLDDGRNAHVLLAPAEWWNLKVSEVFSSIAAFPIYHKSGIQQKQVIAATNDTKQVPMMYGFLMKMKILDVVLSYGPLGNKGS